MFDRNKNKPVSGGTGGTFEPPAQPTAATSQPPPLHSTNNARSTAMIGPSIKIKGEVTGDEDLHIQGRVEGTINLQAHEVVVGESGEVFADVNARTIKIDGKVDGDITASEIVIISRLGNVRGNIVAPRVTLEDGGIFKGSIDMDPGESAAKAPRPVAKEPASIGQADTKPQLDLKSG